MLRICVWLGVVVVFLATNTLVFCQVAGPALPGYQAGINPCKPQPRAEPVARTVQVNVPVPASSCVPPCGFPPPPCGFVCPPPPAQPVRVRVEVVVRPEAPKPCVPQSFCCETPPVFEPIFYHAAGMIQSLIAAPLALGEMFMAHPVPMPLPVLTPMPCSRQPLAMCPPFFQCPPATQCVPPPCPPQVRCALPGPSGKAQPVCVPTSGRQHGPNGPFAR
jgi:hypothetical protein